MIKIGKNKLVIPMYIDIDSTTIDTCQAMCDWYTNKYKHHKNYKKPISKDIYNWNGKDQMPLLTDNDLVEIFNSDFFFENVIPFDNACKVLQRLNNSGRFKIAFCSIGTSTNIRKK